MNKKTNVAATKRRGRGPASTTGLAGQAGFTLIELIILIAVIGLIAAFALPSLWRSRMSAREGSANGALRTVTTSQPETVTNVNLANLNLNPDVVTNTPTVSPKVSETDSPTARDRLYFSYQYFDNVRDGSCCGPITIQRLGADGTALNQGSLPVTVVPTTGDVAVFSDLGCQTPANGLVIPDGSISVPFSIKPTGAGTASLTAQAAGFDDLIKEFTVQPK